MTKLKRLIVYAIGFVITAVVTVAAGALLALIGAGIAISSIYIASASVWMKMQADRDRDAAEALVRSVSSGGQR